MWECVLVMAALRLAFDPLEPLKGRGNTCEEEEGVEEGGGKGGVRQVRSYDWQVTGLGRVKVGGGKVRREEEEEDEEKIMERRGGGGG